MAEQETIESIAAPEKKRGKGKGGQYACVSLGKKKLKARLPISADSF